MNSRIAQLLVVSALLLIVSGLLSVTRLAHGEQASVAPDDPYRMVYAKRQMNRSDKDGDGSFDEAEDAKQWRVKKSFDANQDGTLTIEELAKSPIRYLDSPGEKKLNVLYKTTEEEKLYLDVYFPERRSDEKIPMVIYTHGGGWAVGSKQGIATGAHNRLYQQLLSKGFCVVAVNYRLVDKNGTVSMRDCVIDAKDALRYLSKNADDLGIDTDTFFVQGNSAGGQIAQLLLLSEPETLEGDPQLQGNSYRMLAGVSWYGPCDFEKTELFNHDGRANFRDRFGPRILKPDSAPKDKLRLYREMSPINYLSPDSPPLLLIQGDSDTTIPVHHAHYMQEKAEAAGAPVETLIVRNAGHNWRKVGAEIEPSVNTIVERTVEFLCTHLAKSKRTETQEHSDRESRIDSRINFRNGSQKVSLRKQSPANRMPEFSWDTLPLYIHVRKSAAFTPRELKYLALYPLITFEKTTGSEYLSVHDGYDVNPDREGGSKSKVWLNKFPQYEKRLGPPKGPARQKGYRYIREFEHASVWLDIETERGVVKWK